jgi:hypothetical protein
VPRIGVLMNLAFDDAEGQARLAAFPIVCGESRGPPPASPSARHEPDLGKGTNP